MTSALIRETANEIKDRGTFLHFAYKHAQEKLGHYAPLTVEVESAIYEKVRKGK